MAASRRVSDRWHISRDPIGWAREMGVEIGDNCRFLGVDRATFGGEPYLISLGDHVTITEGVRFITHDGGVWVFREQEPDLDVVGRITIGDNVFLGLRAIIMPGVEIGNDCVVAAGAVVTRSVDQGSVVAGVPARHVKSVSHYREALRGREQRTKLMTAKQKREYFLGRLPHKK